MAKILQQIPQQGFEVVCARIAEILAEEFAHQYAVYLGLNPTVWLERSIPFDETEYPAINVALDHGDYSGATVKKVDGEYVFNVDCYTAAPTSGVNGGDKLSALNLHKILGMCRSILQNPCYRTLGIAAPFLAAVSVNGIRIAAPSNVQDAISTGIGRLEVKMQMPETVELQKGIIIGGSDTTVKLALTDQGYKYIDDMYARQRLISQQGEGFITTSTEQITTNHG